VGVSRREFLSGLAGAGVGFGLGAFSHEFPLPPPQIGPDWRPGKETLVPSTCLLCPAHCGIRARLIDGRLTRIDGNPLHPVSQGGLCPKGRAGIQLYYHPGRLQGPLQRVGPPGTDSFEPISWDAALDRIAHGLLEAQRRGEESRVEWLLGDTSGVVGEVISGFCNAYGTQRIAVDDYRDGSADVMRLCQGIDAPPAFDLASSDFVLSFGAGLSESWWSLPQAARARDASPGRGQRLVQVDVRLSRSAVSADEWIPIRPGTYGTLALGLAYFLFKEGRYDEETIARRVTGWDDWTDESGTKHLGFRRLVLRHGRPDFVSAHTGVPLVKLVSLAKEFGQARRPVALWDQSVSWRAGGLADALAIHSLNIVRGRLNQPGGVLVQSPIPIPGLQGGSAAGVPSYAPLSRSTLLSERWSRNSDSAAPPAPVMFLYRANPLASLAGDEGHRNALSRVPLVVSFSPFLDETARHANLILPEHTYLERWQDAPAPATVAFPVWGVVQPVTKPLYDTRASGDVILDLATRVGGKLQRWARWSSMEEIVRERGTALAAVHRGSAFVEAFRRKELRELEGRGWWLSPGQPAEKYWSTILESGGWFDPFYDYEDRSGMSQHPDGRVHLFPPEARHHLQRSNTDLAEGFLPTKTGPPSAQPADAEFPLRLVPYRVMTLASGGTALMPWLLENLGVLTHSAWETWAEVHPETAERMKLRSGQRVRVESSEGSFEATLRVFVGAQPGVLNVPYGLHTSVDGWGKPRGANPLAAVGSRVDPATKLPDWYSTQVRLVPA
jgi:anaerobic selenocysteine-containing dehydrogenase